MRRKQTSPDPERQLMIKTKACQRLWKEVVYYEQEVMENESTLKGMKDNNRDPYDIKKFQEVLDESYMMVPDSKSRLKLALQDLASYVESNEERCNSSEWYIQATALLSKELIDISDSPQEETALADLKEGEAF